MNNTNIATSANDINMAAADASNLIVEKFHEIFETESMTKVEGSHFFTLIVGVNRW